MTLLLALLAQVVAPPVVSPAAPLVDPRTVTWPAGERIGDALDDLRNDPPVVLIDFLGRRRECALRGQPRAEQARLRCAALAREERAFRARFANDGAALRWLDQAPLDFVLETRLVALFDETDMVQPRRMEQRGVDQDGRAYQVRLDVRADRGRSTRVAVRYDGWPERSFTLDNRIYPRLDSASLQLRLFRIPDRKFIVHLRYGYYRYYCNEYGEDSRELVDIIFSATGVHASVTRRTNCERLYETVRSPAAR